MEVYKKESEYYVETIESSQHPITIAYLNKNFQHEESDTSVIKPVKFTISTESESDNSNKEAIYSNISRFSAFDDALYNR
jgi:hypothetical protein